MAEEVVARQDVVDLEAVATGKTLADVALQEGVMADELLALPIAEHAIVRGTAARLTVERSRHSSFPVPSQELIRAYHRVRGRRAWTAGTPDL
jgi:hypothetical protein